MRIGILTLPLHTNYGGILQAYALQTVLERMGHEVVVINKKNKAPIKSRIRSLLGRIYRWVFRKNRATVGKLPYNYYTNRFISNYVHTRDIFSFKKLKKNDFDAIVVGSDQIWRGKEIFKQIDIQHKEYAYLSFTKGWNIKRIAYAASLGTDDWEYTAEETSKCEVAVQMFDAVSVREKSSIDVLKEKLDVDAQLVLDPTLMLSSDDYRQLTKADKTPNSKGNLLVYILDNNSQIEDTITKLASGLNKKPFSVNYINEDGAANSVEQWLKGFDDADCIITDSFHACVFSIIFNKPFIVFGNVERGLARFTSLLSIFGLENRLYTSFDDTRSMMSNLSDKFDVSKRYAELKEESSSYLTKNLQK